MNVNQKKILIVAGSILVILMLADRFFMSSNHPPNQIGLENIKISIDNSDTVDLTKEFSVTVRVPAGTFVLKDFKDVDVMRRSYYSFRIVKNDDLAQAVMLSAVSSKQTNFWNRARLLSEDFSDFYDDDEGSFILKVQPYQLYDKPIHSLNTTDFFGDETAQYRIVLVKTGEGDYSEENGTNPETVLSRSGPITFTRHLLPAPHKPGFQEKGFTFVSGEFDAFFPSFRNVAWTGTTTLSGGRRSPSPAGGAECFVVPWEETMKKLPIISSNLIHNIKVEGERSSDFSCLYFRNTDQPEVQVLMAELPSDLDNLPPTTITVANFIERDCQYDEDFRCVSTLELVSINP